MKIKTFLLIIILFLATTSTNAQIIWVKKFDEKPNFNICVSNTNIYFTFTESAWYQHKDPSGSQLFSLDYNGNTKWYKKFDSLYFMGLDVKSKDEIYLTGISKTLILDHFGLITNQYENYSRYILSTNDGGFVLYGAGNYARASKYNNSGELVWRKAVGDTNSSGNDGMYFPNGMCELSDGSVLFGISWQFYAIPDAWFFRVGLSGNSLTGAGSYNGIGSVSHLSNSEGFIYTSFISDKFSSDDWGVVTKRSNDGSQHSEIILYEEFFYDAIEREDGSVLACGDSSAIYFMKMEDSSYTKKKLK